MNIFCYSVVHLDPLMIPVFYPSSGIRKLQLILLKVCLCLGVEVHHGVSFEDLLEPPEDQSEGKMIHFHLHQLMEDISSCDRFCTDLLVT